MRSSMKSLITLFAIFYLPSVYAACPNLEGHWNCATKGEEASSIDVTQEEMPGGTLYKVVNQDGELFEYPADGVLHSVEDDSTFGFDLAYCSNKGDIHSERDTRAKDGSFKALLIEDLTLISGNEFHSNAEYRLESGGKVEQREYQSVCSK